MALNIFGYLNLFLLFYFSANQQPALPANKPISNVVPNQYHHPQNHPHMAQQQPQLNTPACELIYPNAITYHHSVNIHNYVGNYCMGAPIWKPEYVWDRPMPSHTPFYERPDTPQLLNKHEQQDPLANINTTGLELARCSTPEYLMALNSLGHMNSPPRPNHSLAMNYNCTASFDDSTSRSVNNIKHDSGYNSDLGASPVIQIQDGNIKLLQRQHTSTPEPTPVPMSQFNKENMAPNHHEFLRPKYPLPMSAFQSKPQCSEIRSHNLLMQSGSYLQSTLQTTSPTEAPVLNNSVPKYKTMADYQMSKKVKTESVKSVKSAKRKSESEQVNDGKRRRHNEPLNNDALSVMNVWYEEHAENPYPTKPEKDDIAKRGGISLAQVKSWFANKRNRSHNTRPKKQKKEMEGRLMDICHQLAIDASKPDKDNAYYIQQLSSILDRTKY